jgi:hypothetical protein
MVLKWDTNRLDGNTIAAGDYFGEDVALTRGLTFGGSWHLESF